MPGKRAKDKGRIEGWLRIALLERVRGKAGRHGLNDTQVLEQALTAWADDEPATQATQTEGEN